MFDEPEETPPERQLDPAARAREKADEFRMHAELAAVFEGPRKFDARVLVNLDPQAARDVQRTMGRLEKSRPADGAILPTESSADAARLLNLPRAGGPSAGDYHLSRRPGEVMVVRWLEGEQVETFYERLQAHFDAALGGYREEERQTHGWKQDPKTLAYLAALDALEVPMAERYRRELIRTQNLYVLSTHTVDELNIRFLAEDVMGTTVEELVGQAAAPPEEAEQDVAWFYKLFALRGMNAGVEQMCFFAYLQKSDEDGW